MYSLVDVLAQTNRFRVEDLSENRQGRLSAAQKFRLWRRILQPVFIFVLILLIFIALFVALGAVDENGYYLRAALRESGGRIVLILLLVPIFALAFLWRSLKLMLDLRDGSVASVEGHVNKVMSFNYKSSAMFYCIGDLRFKVSNQAYNALVENTTYRIFYTPHSNFLVSIEPTGAAADPSIQTGQFTHLAAQVPQDRNPYLRRGLAWYFGLMFLSVVICLIFYFFSPSPITTNAGHHSPSDNTQHTRTGVTQK